MDFEDLSELIQEYKTGLIICGLGVVAAANLLTGGGQQLQSKFAQNAADSAAKDRQARAEALYQEQKCVAQAISADSGTSNFTVGDTPIDPVSITSQNPAGTPINSGLLCSSDGSLFAVENGKIVELIGTSPLIRAELIRQGFAQEARKMQRRAAQQEGI